MVEIRWVVMKIYDLKKIPVFNCRLRQKTRYEETTLIARGGDQQ